MKDADVGEEVWRGYCLAPNPAPLSKSDSAAAVRYTLKELEKLHPGRSVEVRVIPYGAVQILAGATHRRGTPPAVVEMDAETWLQLASGRLGWDEAEKRGLVDASGERSNLSPYLPI